MDERQSGRRLPCRGVLVVLAMATGWSLPSAAGSAQADDAQTRACNRLQAALTRVGDRGAAANAIAARLQRFGCTTSTLGPTTTFIAGTTTTVVHQDCPLPGGGVGPCPTTSVVGPGTTVGPVTTVGPGTTVGTGGTTSTVGLGATTTTVGPETTAPGDGTTVPSPSTTLPRCSTTTTSSGQVPTTIPCAP